MNNNTINLSGKMFAVGELVRRGFTIKKQNLVFNKQALVNVSKRLILSFLSSITGAASSSNEFEF